MSDEHGYEMIENQRIQCWDFGPGILDRYTVIFLDQPEHIGTQPAFATLAMNHRPFHPQGFGQHLAAMSGPHLGQRVLLADLPDDCQRMVRRELEASR